MVGVVALSTAAYTIHSPSSPAVVCLAVGAVAESTEAKLPNPTDDEHRSISRCNSIHAMKYG